MKIKEVKGQNSNMMIVDVHMLLPPLAVYDDEGRLGGNKGARRNLFSSHNIGPYLRVHLCFHTQQEV